MDLCRARPSECRAGARARGLIPRSKTSADGRPLRLSRSWPHSANEAQSSWSGLCSPAVLPVSVRTEAHVRGSENEVGVPAPTSPDGRPQRSRRALPSPRSSPAVCAATGSRPIGAFGLPTADRDDSDAACTSRVTPPASHSWIDHGTLWTSDRGLRRRRPQRLGSPTSNATAEHLVRDEVAVS